MTARAPEGDRITDVAGIGVGHHHVIDPDATLGAGGPDDPPGTGWATGTTVVTVSRPEGAAGAPTAAVDVRGGGPGTRETD
ncbi:P1 family peptidase, partial [Mycobacterium tuberculosis]|nr:P1 family peptidase [Mycobacterium tuberculosis]